MVEVYNYLSEVREMYEKYPYPKRIPEDESKRIIQTNLDMLDRVNHYCLGGKESFSKGFYYSGINLLENSSYDELQASISHRGIVAA